MSRAITRRSVVSRDSRSTAGVMTTSPGARAFISLASCGRSAVVPVIFSRNTFAHPAALSWRTWLLSSWAAVYDAMDPFVVLAAAAQATKTIKLGTGVALIQQRDAIQTAKLVASIDQVSQGRFLFGIGGGWNQDEMEDHGTVYATRFKRVRESIEAMKEIWTKEKAEYHGEFVNFDPMIARPKPVQKPHPPIHVGGAFPHGARRAIRYGDGWIPGGDVREVLPKFREMAREAGRNPAAIEITSFALGEDIDRVKRLNEMGVTRVVPMFPPEKADKVLPIVDRWANIMRQVSR